MAEKETEPQNFYRILVVDGGKTTTVELPPGVNLSNLEKETDTIIDNDPMLRFMAGYSGQPSINELEDKGLKLLLSDKLLTRTGGREMAENYLEVSNAFNR